MRITKKLLQNRLDYINECLGTKYILDHQPVYGGYSIILVGSHGEHYCGEIGTYERKSAKETLIYLDGIIKGISATKK